MQCKIERLLSEEEKIGALAISILSTIHGFSAKPSTGEFIGLIYNEGVTKQGQLIATKLGSFGGCPFGILKDLVLSIKEVLILKSKCLIHVFKICTQLENKEK
jgi:hypothetical protein